MLEHAGSAVRMIDRNGNPSTFYPLLTCLPHSFFEIMELKAVLPKNAKDNLPGANDLGRSARTVKRNGGKALLLKPTPSNSTGRTSLWMHLMRIIWPKKWPHAAATQAFALPSGSRLRGQLPPQ
ncbi:MAG: hypothetical protein R2788_19105 [Saprospiraceae bacterium]